MVVAPTSWGKTIFFAALIRWWFGRSEKSVIVIAHRDELLNRAALIGKVGAGVHDYGARTTVASIDTISLPRHLENVRRSGYGLVVCEVRAIAIRTETSLDALHIERGDYNEQELEAAIDVRDRKQQWLQCAPLDWAQQYAERQARLLETDENNVVLVDLGAGWRRLPVAPESKQANWLRKFAVPGWARMTRGDPPEARNDKEWSRHDEHCYRYRLDGARAA